MRYIFYLTWRYILSNKFKAGLLITCFFLAFFIGFSSNYLIKKYEKNLNRRAKETPFVLGSMGDRFDLILSTLYFRGKLKNLLNYNDFINIQKSDRGLCIPMVLGNSSRNFSIIGTSLEYFNFRKLELKSGTLPLILGETVVGHNVGKLLNLNEKSYIITDPKEVFNIAASYPLKLKVVGVLKPNNKVDDNAIFLDIKTAWIIEGFGHGHSNKVENVKKIEDKTITYNSALVEYQEINDENIQSFHFHSQMDILPISSVIFIPNSEKDKVIMKGIYNVKNDLQLIKSKDVIDELLSIIFKVKKILNICIIIIICIIILFSLITIFLSLRLRKNEQKILEHIGCDKMTFSLMQICEIFIYVLISLFLTIVVLLLTLNLLPNIDFWLK